MQKWIQFIIIVLALALCLAPISTVPMEKAVADVSASEIVDETEAAVVPTEQPDATAEPSVEPTPVPTVEATAEPTPAPTAEPTPVPELPACIPVNTGNRDAEGETAIREIQQRLIDLNYLFDVADGIFGTNSTNAVFAFQAANGLPEYGIVDEATYYALFSDGAIAGPEPTPTPLMSGAEGETVTLIQTKLARWGFLTFEPDGSYGDGTKQGVMDFQQYLYDYGMTFATEQLPTILGVDETAAPTPTAEPTPEPTVAPTQEPLPTNADGTTAEPTSVPEPTLEPTPTPYAPDGAVDDQLLAYLTDGRFDVYRADVQNGVSGAEAYRVQRRMACLGYMYSTACDGVFGSVSELALKYFQRRNNLPETGIADEDTQLKLFSDSAVKSNYVVYPYYLVVDVSEQRVHAYQWTGSDYSKEVRTMVCSTGKTSTPTPLGTYSCDGRACDRWYYFKEFHCYAQYAYRIFGGILFHSVTYSSMNESTISRGALNNLGKRASHGCVRLTVEDAKWIFDNCPNGTTVTIQE